jgi:hypothetical protein
MLALVSLQLWQVCWGNGSYPKIWRLRFDKWLDGDIPKEKRSRKVMDF